jgi:hypothetical protein
LAHGALRHARSAGVSRTYPPGDESRQYAAGYSAGGPDAPDYQTISSAIITLANDPNSVMTFARTTGATDFTRQMAAKRSPASRVTMWKTPG